MVLSPSLTPAGEAGALQGLSKYEVFVMEVKQVVHRQKSAQICALICVLGVETGPHFAEPHFEAILRCLEVVEVYEHGSSFDRDMD